MINKIELFEFQSDAVTYLLDKTNDINSKKKIKIKSPTGSGKTIILQSYIEQYLLNINHERIFIWLTPGMGNLEEQSRIKMEGLIPNAKTGDIYDVLLQGFQIGTTYFINWEMITNKKNNALKDTERKNLFHRIAEAHRNNKKFIVLIDEEHLNNTSKANDILSALNHDYEIRVSATTKEDSTSEYYEIPEVEVINSGLITRALYINEGIDINEIEDIETEAKYLLTKADDKRKEIATAYREVNENIRPLIIIQFPDMSNRLIEFVEETLATMGYTYENKLVAKWLSDSKINIDGITKDNGKPKFLLMKQAIATGWDCPRAKILVKLRENMNEIFETQTLGRLRRMPRARHYGDERLDFCYLYTFDEKYKDMAINDGNAFEVKRLFLKKNIDTINLKKELRNHDYEYVNEKEVRDKAYKFFKNKYNLTNNKKRNVEILENNNFIIGTKIFSRYRTGKFQKLTDIPDEKTGDYRNISYEVNTHIHGIDCLHAVDQIKKVIGLPAKKTRAILQHLFYKKITSHKKILNFSNKEWYAFIINNADRLRDDFQELASLPNERQMQFLEKKEIDFNLPLEDFYRYIPYEKGIEVYESNAYEEYDTSMTVDQLRSTSEQLFELHCEERDDIEWVYKNGDSGKQYLSIVYGTNISKEYLFYPDYIIKKRNGEVWIIETKGGELQGKSKNIDKQIANKFIAFKEYAERHKVNWGFVRDRNQRLYINNTVYTEDMNNSYWRKLTDEF